VFSRDANRKRKALKCVAVQNRGGVKDVCSKNKISLTNALLRSNLARFYGKMQNKSRQRL
jgi:hypothetical protein